MSYGKYLIHVNTPSEDLVLIMLYQCFIYALI